jgi:hypothetical protein
MGLITINAEKKAAIDLRKMEAEADAWFASAIAAGFTSPTSGVTLNLTDADVALLTGNFVLAKEAAAMELPLPPVIDAHGTPHNLSLQELTELMLEYGQHRAALSAEYAGRRAGNITEE